MKKLNIKRLPLGVFTLFLLVGLGGCGNDEETSGLKKTSDVTIASNEDYSEKKEKGITSIKKSSSLDKKTTEIYIKKAEDDISLLNKGKIEELKKQFSNVMTDITTNKDLDEIRDMIKKAGKFEKLEEMSVEEEDNNYITKLTVKYSESDLVFTISYDNNNKIINLLVK